MPYTREYKGKKLDDKIAEYVVVDIETTGLSPAQSKIIEIAALKVKEGEVIDRFQKLVNPQTRISPMITHLTGITNDMVQDADTIDIVLEEFRKFVQDAVIVGHNVNFDINFLYDNLYQTHQQYLTNNFVDTMYLSRNVLKGLPNYKLESLTQYFNVSYDGAHRALNDCIFTYECYERLKELY